MKIHLLIPFAAGAVALSILALDHLDGASRRSSVSDGLATTASAAPPRLKPRGDGDGSLQQREVRHLPAGLVFTRNDWRESEEPEEVPAPLELSDEELLRREVEEEERVTSFFQSTFERDPRDPRWASGQESDIQALFAADEMFAGNRLEALDCRSALCRLEVSHESLESRGRMSVPWMPGPFAHGSFIRYDAERDRTVIYLGREGRAFAMPTSDNAEER